MLWRLPDEHTQQFELGLFSLLVLCLKRRLLLLLISGYLKFIKIYTWQTKNKIIKSGRDIRRVVKSPNDHFSIF